MPAVSEKQRRFLQPEQAAYLAGLLDGEGYFSISWRSKPTRGYKYYRWEIRITVSTTTREFLEKVAKMVPWGGGTVGLTSRRLKGRAKPAWRISWSGNSAIEVCRAIHPYVLLKNRHVELILAVASAKAEAQSERTGMGHRYPQKIADLMRDTSSIFSVINRRGQNNACIH